MKFKRQFTEVVEAERIPLDPRISDLVRISDWADCYFEVQPGDRGVPVIVWSVEGRYQVSEGGQWITQDEFGCLTWWKHDDFEANFTPLVIEP